MADKKFSQFTDGLTNQSPADELVGLDISLPASQQNTRWTLNDLFSKITRNIADKVVRLQAGSSPTVAGNNESAIYSDGTQLLVSNNGSAYAPIGGAFPSGSASELQFRNSSTEFGAVTNSSVSGGDITMSGILQAKLQDAGGQVFNVKAFGAKGDTKTVNNGAITIGTPTLTSATAGFTSADTGKTFIVRGAGSAGVPLVATGTYVNSTTITLSVNASVTVTDARVDYGTLDIGAFNSATAAIPSTGGVLLIPPGNYMLGATTAASKWTIERGYLTITGSGMGVTKLMYSSQSTDHITYGSGSGLSIGTPAAYNQLTDFQIADLTFEDVSNVTAILSSDPSGIVAFYVNNFSIRRVQVINAKGNGGITVSGSLSGGLPTEDNLWIEDCILLGTSAGNWMEGDGINVGNYQNVHVTGCYITGTGRHAFEGGGSLRDTFFFGNFIDMQGRGFSGINPTGAVRSTVIGNIVLNVAAPYYGIDYTSDAGLFPLLDLTVIGNQVTSTTATYAMRIQNTSGVGSDVNKIRIESNYLQAIYGIVLGASDFPNLKISNNVFDLGNLAQLLNQAGAPGGPTPIAGRQVIITENVLVNGSSYPLDFVSTFSNWASSRNIRVENNTIGTSLTDGTTNQYGGHVNVGAGPGFSLAANTSAQIGGGAITMTGAIPGDQVIAVGDASWPPQLVISGWVTAQNLLEIWIYNPTSGPLTIPDFTHPLRVFIKRW